MAFVLSMSMSRPLPAKPFLRPLLIALIVLIMLASTASAIQGLRAGHTARATSTFFAGLSFSILFWTRLPKRAG